MKNISYITLFVILGIVVCELILRINFGFCDAPLYVYSERYEYIVAPSQNGKRFGNSYRFNSFSQRSEEPDSTKTIILGLGDSILFGGTLTDQDSLATSLITKNEANYQVLNISAGSWGPDNAAAYLSEKGLFNAKAMFLVASSHDAFDNMNFLPVVGKHPAYPNKQYSLALTELLHRYIFPRAAKALIDKISIDSDQNLAKAVEIRKDGVVFNPGFNQIKQIADSVSIPFLIVLHADKSECRVHNYNEQGQLIKDWAESNKIDVIQDLEHGMTESDYRDAIHLNNKGQAKLARAIRKKLTVIL